MSGYAGAVSKDSYHHGDLKAAILVEAAKLVADRGADGVSLRELARTAGVSHAAPAHHFTDRRGLFTALATEGYRLLAAALATEGYRLLAAALTDARPRFVDAAKAYVRFALDHPGHYEVMFDKSLYDEADPELTAAAGHAGAELNRGVSTLTDEHAENDPEGAALAAWSLVHGFSLLWLNDAIDTKGDPVATVERLAGFLFEV
jgi:AcrR family transcriptional regulator